jgi:chromosome segregation ATPase
MSAAPEPVEPAVPPGTPEISEAAQLARERLHQEIERVRNGVEEMLDEQEINGNGHSYGKGSSKELRRELAELRIETRDYVKKKVRKSEKRLERSVRELEARSDKLEDRIDEVESDREAAEVRIHNTTEDLLDGLLDDVRAIADRLARQPAPPAAPTPPKLAPPPPPQASAPQAPVGRVGPRPLGRRTE